MSRIKSTWVLVFTTCCVSGCTHMHCPDGSSVSSAIERRINKQVQWNHECYQDDRIDEHVQSLLENDLTVDITVQIALLNNPKIQEIFEDIGIAQADLIEAGLFSNPAFDLIFRYPEKKDLKTNIEYTITSSFIDLFLIPLRVKVAKADLEKTILLVTNQVLNLAFEVEETFYELQASHQNLKYIQSIVALAGIQSELTSRQLDVGNINSLEFQEIQSRYLEAELKLASIQNDNIRLKEKLNRLLGFCHDIEWKISDTISEVNYQDSSLECLENIAFTERLDLQAARYDVLRLSRLLGIKQWWVYTQGRLGVGGERDTDGANVIGPAIIGEIPIFNYGQADRLRIEAELRKTQDHLAALEIQILSEVRESHKLLTNNLRIIKNYKTHIIPLQNKLTETSTELYNVMGIGVDRLLEIKHQEFQTQSNYILALRNYWIAKIQLDRALGGKLYLSNKDLSKQNIPTDTHESSKQHNIQENQKETNKISRTDKEIFKNFSIITPNVGSLPWTMDGDVKVFHLIAEPIRREFSPGFWVNCWGYNGTSPGPTIEAVEGDRVRILVTNKLNEPTSVHWHGIILPNGMDGVTGLNQKGIPPGDTFKYEFTLKQNGTFMYHPHADEMIQVALGMEGFFIIHPKDGDNPPVDRDFALFLHEWHIPMGAKTPNPAEMFNFNLFTFNSVLYPTIEPLIVKTGERVRIRLGNALMNSHPIHLHGHEFTVTRKGGRRLPPSAQYSEVTVSVESGETRDIEFIADNPGDWAFHCHKSHHTMNQMQHDIPNLTGINKENMNDRIREFFPDFMGLMNINGMGEMFEMYGTSEMTHMGMKMKYPPNISPIGNPGPFGVIEMGGMFTIVKVRDNLANYADPGWYKHPPGTVAESIYPAHHSEDQPRKPHETKSTESWFSQEENSGEKPVQDKNWMHSNEHH